MLATRSAVLALALLGAVWGTSAAGAELTVDELRARIEAAGGRADLADLDLTELNLAGFDFQGADLRGTVLKRANLALAASVGISTTARGDTLALTEVAPGVWVHQGVHELPTPDNLGGIANIGFIVGADAVP